DHEEEERQRESEDAKNACTKVEEDQSHHDDDERAPHQEKFGADIAEDQLDDPDHQHEETDPAPLLRKGSQLVATLPDDEATEDGNEKAMRVVRVVPPLRDEISDDR